jgi:hypothetical protein
MIGIDGFIYMFNHWDLGMIYHWVARWDFYWCLLGNGGMNHNSYNNHLIPAFPTEHQ